MKKSIFKASFEENLNLLDDGSLQFAKKDYYEHLGKGLNNGRPSIGFRIKSIIFTILFVFGGNFMLAVFAFSLNDADPKDLSIPIFKPQLLTPEFFFNSLVYLVDFGSNWKNFSKTIYPSIQISISYCNFFNLVLY